jgi:hypothetical protein
MSTRVHANISLGFARQAGLAYASGTTYGTTYAIPTINPNSLPSGPQKQDAIGIAGQSGIVTFATEQASQTYNIYEWSDLFFNATVAAGVGPIGWVFAGATSTVYGNTVAQYAKATITLPENALFFIQAVTNPCVIALLGGCHKYGGQTVQDLQKI